MHDRKPSQSDLTRLAPSIAKRVMLVLFALSMAACSEQAGTKMNSANAEKGTSSGHAATNSHPGASNYKAYCKVCHAQGINGAPVLGNTAMWSKRLSKGRDELVQSAIHGYGLMPANLGRDEALDETGIAEVVDYMLSELP